MPVAIAVLTVSDTREAGDDRSGDTLAERIEGAGHRLAARAIVPDEPDEIYIVQPGDTLGRIAQRIYGEFRLWTIIFEANRDKISNPGLIRGGMELLIPKRE